MYMTQNIDNKLQDLPEAVLPKDHTIYNPTQESGGSAAVDILMHEIGQDDDYDRGSTGLPDIIEIIMNKNRNISYISGFENQVQETVVQYQLELISKNNMNPALFDGGERCGPHGYDTRESSYPATSGESDN